MLTAADIMKQRLRAGLVTLSACETALSSVRGGDEIIGLSRAFLTAGVPSLVLSLWKVNDESTFRLMRSFYEHLIRQKSPPSALREGQLSLIKNGDHPYFWGPFIAIGR
jgi:CHAT domain-containing protein